MVDPSRFAVCLATMKYPANLDAISFAPKDHPNAAHPKPVAWQTSTFQALDIPTFVLREKPDSMSDSSSIAFCQLF